jgi:hypothetical protein
MQMVVRRIGEPKAGLADPSVQNSVYSYYGAPILRTMGNVIAYSRQRRASVAPRRHRTWSTGQRESGPSSRAVLSPIFTTSAVGGGEFTRRVPTAANSALDEATGRVSRGWALPTAEQTIGNMTLTDTLGFVSTNKAIYAIPTPRRHPHPIWSVAAEGDMALTSDGTLIVTGQAPDYGDPRALAAYRLRQRG